MIQCGTIGEGNKYEFDHSKFIFRVDLGLNRGRTGPETKCIYNRPALPDLVSPPVPQIGLKKSFHLRKKKQLLRQQLGPWPEELLPL